MDDQLNILIKQCQKNKRQAQAEIYKRFSAKLFSVCLRYSNHYEDAQDNFQEGFIQIFNKIDQFRFQGSFEGWMRRIMVNYCIEKHREKNHLFVINEEITPDYDSEEPDLDSTDDQDFTYEELLDFIKQLPDRYRQVFNLYVIDGYTHQQIADLLHISVGTSKSNLSRAREKLIEMIKNSAIKLVSE